MCDKFTGPLPTATASDAPCGCAETRVLFLKTVAYSTKCSGACGEQPPEQKPNALTVVPWKPPPTMREARARSEARAREWRALLSSDQVF